MDDRVESYFCYSASDTHGQTPSRVDDSVDDFLFVVSGCNTPVVEPTHVDPDTTHAAASHLQHHRHIADETQHGNSRHSTPGTSAPYDSSPIEPSRPGATEDKWFRSTGAVHDSSKQHPTPRSPTTLPAAIRDTKARSTTSYSTGSGARGAQRPPPAPAARATDARTRGIGDQRRGALSRTTRTATVVDAYNPTGIPGSAASLGKYYPSNYEAPEAAGSLLQTRGPAASHSPMSLPGMSQERQLRQYKLDMINQTLQNAREALGRTLQSPASIKAVETMLDEGARKSVASGFALLSRYKPSSPRITPLLSPGPVTPMALDENAESDYLTVRGTSSR